MPIYDYHCNDCSSDFEQLVRSMFSQETVACPDCGSQHVKKAISLLGGVTGSGGQRSSNAPAQACAPTG